MRHNYISWQKTFLVYYFGWFYLLKNNFWVKSVVFEKCSAFGHYTVKNRKKSTFFLRASKKRVIHVLFKNRTSCDLKVRRSLSKKFFGSVDYLYVYSSSTPKIQFWLQYKECRFFVGGCFLFLDKNKIPP